MRRLKENSATGPDGLPASLLKRIATSIAPNITTILNHSLSCSAFPNSWKKANITPIWKGKGSKVDVGNYRPISVTPIIARLFERFCAKQLSTYCEAHQIIPVQQFGFRPKSSCELALLHALDHWIKDIDSGRFVGALLIDLSKAFDSVSHQLLINDLADIGCTPPTVNWFLNYLSNRVQKVVDPRNNTSWSLVTKGVPQGSCLSPLLFNIFLRNLPVATSVKLLGVTLDQHLSFNDHIYNVTKKCHGLIGLLASAAPYLSKDLLRLAYIALIRSHLEYSSAIFASATPTQLQRLEVIQKISSRVICSAPRDAHAAPLLQSLSLLPLEARRRSHITSLVQTILSGNCHPAFKGLFNLTPEGMITNKEKSRIKYGRRRFSIYARDLLNSTQTVPFNPTSNC